MVLDFRGNGISGKSVVCLQGPWARVSALWHHPRKRQGSCSQAPFLRIKCLGRSHDSENNFTVSDFALGFRIWG